jgi:hypothetical protein
MNPYHGKNPYAQRMVKIQSKMNPSHGKYSKHGKIGLNPNHSKNPKHGKNQVASYHNCSKIRNIQTMVRM